MNLRRSGRSRSYIPNPEWQDCKINLLMLSTSSRAGTGTFTSRLPSPHSDPVQTVDWYFAPVLIRDFPMVRKIIHNNIANYLFHMMFPFQDEWSSLNLHQSWHNNTITTKVLISFSTNHRIWVKEAFNKNKHFEPVLGFAADFFLQLGSCKEAVR